MQAEYPLRRAGIALLLSSFVSGCSSCGKKESPAGSTPSAHASAGLVASTPIRRSQRSWPVPGGPRFAILPGQGIGPIRLGATIATIERHMQSPCDEVTDSRCRYFARAVDFELAKGVTRSIYISRAGRAAGGVDADGNPRTYGIFNGIILPDLMLGMTPQAIHEGLGPPKRVEKAGKNPHGTEEIHHYDGMLLEYDRIPQTGLLALGAVKIVK
jgi:hypothetical protein